MKKSLLQQLLLYRYRYAVAYTLFFALLITLLGLQLTSVPSGLSAEERASVVESMRVSFDPDTSIVNLPYHVYQKASIKLFGFNEYAIKLPSLLFAFLSGIGVILLLRRWFTHNVAIISALFIVTNVLFLSAARAGTPDIMLIFFSTFILLFATLITQEVRGQFFWKILFGALIAASLYTPLSVYVIFSCAVAGLLHPHARFLLRRYGGRQFVGALFLFIPLAIPLAVGLWKRPEVSLQLLGFDQGLPSAREFLQSFIDLATRLGGVTEPYAGEFIQPAFSIVSLALIGLGLLRALMDFHATRTYALLIWLAVIAPAVIISQDYLPILFVPSVLLIAIGLQTLIREWYALFPHNPYARIVGLMPLLVLIGGVISFNYATYFNGLRYSTDAARVHSADLRLLNQVLASDRINRSSLTVAVASDDIPFFSTLAREGAPIKVVSTEGFKIPVEKGTVITSEELEGATEQPALLTVSDRKDDALRWRTYVRW